MLTGWFERTAIPTGEDDNHWSTACFYLPDEDGALKTSWLDYSRLELKGLEELCPAISAA